MNRNSVPTALLILGMHRSGTSVITRIMNLLGVDLGSGFIAPAVDNPSGFWEHEGAYKIHERLLAALGRNWHDTSDMPVNWEDDPAAVQALVDLGALIDTEFATSPVWAVKDPRMCRFAPLWIRAVRKRGMEAKVLLVVREPFEVAESLRVRDNWMHGRSYLLWVQHLLEAERATRGIARTIVSYDALMRDWRASVERVSASLGLSWAVPIAEREQAIDGYVNPRALRHHVVCDAMNGNNGGHIPEMAADLYSLARRIESGHDDWKIFNRFERQYVLATNLFAPAMLVDREQARRERDMLLSEKDRAWEQRLEQVATDYGREIERIGAERDVLLSEKDRAWEQRLEQVGTDYGHEIERIGAERDVLLSEKDRAWGQRLEQVGTDYGHEIERIGAERDVLLSEKDRAWEQRLEQCAIFKDMVPLVSLIIVNYNGLRFLPGLLQSLMALDYPRYEVVLVDNASSDASLLYVAEHFPVVRIIQSKWNLGFAGGNNLGIKAARGDLIGLINNDAEVESGWLRELVSSLVRHPEAWAVGSKIVFFRRYIEVTLKSGIFCPSDFEGSSDRRELGMLLDESSAFVGCDYRKPIFESGFWWGEQLPDRHVRWTNGEARLFLPVMPENDISDDVQLSLIFSGTDAGAGQPFSIHVAGELVLDGILSSTFQEHLIRVSRALIDSSSFKLLNNAGTNLDELGNAGDRGIYEPDRGQYDREEDVQALCGAAMLMRRSALERIGLFDSSFFMYYEDTDLCWRMRRAGGKLRYVPTSLVRHIHTGSSVEWSPTFIYYVTRNHILIRFKHATWGVAIRGYLTEILRVVRLSGSVASLMRRRRAKGSRELEELRLRLRLQWDLLKKIPIAISKRFGYRGGSMDRLRDEE